MTIGLDFDNTIVSYDRLFHRVALDLGLIPESVPVQKNAVRDYLRSIGKEPVWTEMQGIVYGARMNEADPFPSALETINSWKRNGHRVVIISHKTRYPFLGEKYDLHAAARGWLETNGFYDPSRIGLDPDDVFFELTKEGKLARVAQLECSYFIDDLPEILSHSAFPLGVTGILFDPGNALAEVGCWPRALSWTHLAELVTA